MSIETPLLTAFVAAAGAVLIAVIGLIASVHYRLGKLEKGQEALPQEDAHTREMLTQEITQTRKMVVEGDAKTRELLSHVEEMSVQRDAQTRKMVVEGDAQTRELLSHMEEMSAQRDAQTRELIVREVAFLRERSDAQHAETMSAIQRLTDAFLSHSHDTDGAIRFRIPPPPQQPARTDDEP